MGHGPISAAILAVLWDDVEDMGCDDCDCEVLPQLGDCGSKKALKDPKFGDKLSKEELREIRALVLVGSFYFIFSDRPASIIMDEHCIELMSLTPVPKRPYPVSYGVVCDLD
ncbi:hypothetical protein PoB_001874700 [Plakobranchus ocellatus]|uniref:Uncharacterized protein n=1 Tax=Plakobranchus ocellatus TaxID=259542 RepID=A0AAV3ZCJ9_9GAST|nr:hypothetical protein PoB_001874700 [Plakobranchus ocellatus]